MFPRWNTESTQSTEGKLSERDEPKRPDNCPVAAKLASMPSDPRVITTCPSIPSRTSPNPITGLLLISAILVPVSLLPYLALHRKMKKMNAPLERALNSQIALSRRTARIAQLQKEHNESLLRKRVERVNTDMKDLQAKLHHERSRLSVAEGQLTEHRWVHILSGVSLANHYDLVFSWRIRGEQTRITL